MTGRLDQDRDRTDESGVVAPSRVMLVAIVLVAVAAVTYIAGLGSGADEAEVASTASSRSTASSPPADPSSSAAPSASSTPSAATTTPTPTKKASPETTAQPTQQPSAATPAVQRGQIDVSVFNNSSRTGLAARTSAKVKGAGWKVIGTDNWYGTIPQPTVYYPARLKAAADLLAKDTGIDRVKPAVTPMREDRLTLIVTGDYTA